MSASKKTMKKLLLALALLLLASPANAAFFAGSTSPFGTLPQTLASFGTMGDSVCVGQCASDTTLRWVALFQNSLGGATLIDRCASGTVWQNENLANGSPGTLNGRSRFYVDFMNGRGTNCQYKTNLATIAYGYNDMRYTAAPATMNVTNFEIQYRQGLNGILSNGCYASPSNVLLVTPYYMTTIGFASGSGGFTGSSDAVNQQYGDVVRRVAKDYGVYIADAYTALKNAGASDGSLSCTDHVHFNDAGYAVIANSAIHAVKNNPHPQLTGLTASSPGAGQMTVSWTSAGLSSYEIDVGVYGEPYELPYTLMVGTNTGTITGLPTGSYIARVRGQYSDGSYSPWAWYTTDVVVP